MSLSPDLQSQLDIAYAGMDRLESPGLEQLSPEILQADVQRLEAPYNILGEMGLAPVIVFGQSPRSTTEFDPVARVTDVQRSAVYAAIIGTKHAVNRDMGATLKDMQIRIRNQVTSELPVQNRRNLVATVGELLMLHHRPDVDLPVDVRLAGRDCSQGYNRFLGFRTSPRLGNRTIRWGGGSSSHTVDRSGYVQDFGDLEYTVPATPHSLSIGYLSDLSTAEAYNAMPAFTTLHLDAKGPA